MTEEKKQNGDRRSIQAFAEVGLLAFLKATEKQLETAIRHASDMIDAFPFIGWKSDADQARAWPRSGAYSPDGFPLLDTPVEIEEICYLLAGLFLAEVPLQEPLNTLIVPKIGHLLKRQDDQAEAQLVWH